MQRTKGCIDIARIEGLVQVGRRGRFGARDGVLVLVDRIGLCTQACHELHPGHLRLSLHLQYRQYVAECNGNVAVSRRGYTERPFEWPSDGRTDQSVGEPPSPLQRAGCTRAFSSSNQFRSTYP
jgi:hypothetical protein